LVFVPTLAGAVTFSVTDPFEQGTLADNVAIVGFEETTQVTAFVTVAERTTAPPEEPRADGLSAKDATVGVGAPRRIDAPEIELKVNEVSPPTPTTRAALTEMARTSGIGPPPLCLSGRRL
jgi:hypothetical protein